MPTLPAVFVELKATTESFQASFADAQKTVKNFSDQSTSGLQKLQDVGKVAFVALGAAATTYGAMAVKAALDGQQAHAQLVQAVQNSGTAFAGVSSQVDDMAERFAKLGYENDQVDAALTRLVQATGSTTTAMANMNLVADIARARNISLTDAAGDLGKILAGNMRGMTAFGLSTKDAGGNTLTTAAAVKELNDRFGGAAQANAGTYMGKLQALNAEWHNMTEAVGNELLPTLANLASDMASVVGWFGQHTQVVQGLAFAIGGPLVIAMSAYIAKQAVAFGTGVINAVKGVASVISGLLVPATEAEEAAMTGAAVAESILTAGLTIAAGVAAAYVIHQASAGDATKSVAAATDQANSAVGAFDATETETGATVEDTTSKLKAQQKQFEDLAGSTNSQDDLILKLIGDQEAVAKATQKLTDSTGANSEASKWAIQHTKDLAQANKDLKQANTDVTTAIDAQAAAQKKLNDLLAPQTQRNITDAADAHSAANDRLTRANIAVTDKTKDLNAAISQYGQGSEEATLAQLDLNDALREVDDAQNAVTDTTQTLGDAQRQTIGSSDEITQATKDLDSASQAVKDAQDKQTAAQQKLNEVQSQDNSAALATDRANLASDTLAAAQATQQLREDQKSLMDLLGLPGGEQLRQQLITDIKNLGAAFPGIDKTGALKDIIGELTGPIPPNSLLSTLQNPQALTPAINGLSSAVQNPALQGFFLVGGALASPGTQATPNPTPGQGTHGGLPASSPTPPGGTGPAVYLLPAFGVPRASGGPVRAGSAYIVGENGPEPFIPSTNGTIIPNGGLGGTVNINIYGNGRDDQELAMAVRDELLKAGKNLVGVGLG